MKVFVPLISIGVVILIWGAGCSNEEEGPPPEKKQKVVQRIIKPLPENPPPEVIKNSVTEQVPEPMAKKPPEVMNSDSTGAGSGQPEPIIQQEKATSGNEPGIYIVKEGESLSSISGQAEVYGSPLKWPILFRYNMDKLSGLELGEDLPDSLLPQDVRLKIVAPEEFKKNLQERADKFWIINIISTTSSKEVVSPAIKLMKSGYSIYITSALVKGKSYLRLRVGFFKNQSEAAAAGKAIMELLKTTEFWPTRVTKSEHGEFAGY